MINKQFRLGCRRWNRPFWAILTALALIALWLMAAIQATAAESVRLQSVQVSTPSELNRKAVFWYWQPWSGAPLGVLLLVPGCNGDGRGMLAESSFWASFADEQHLVLVGPSFHTTLEEVHSRKGYYYPELWSGKATLEALDKIRARTGIKSDKVLIFGFSAGAHFAHRFALWRPDKVTAFVAYSAGWWDAPKTAPRNTPGLIMCGEADERFVPTYAFFAQGRKLGLPLVWRGYTGIGHELTPQVVKTAQAFLKFYASGEKPQNLVGDIQSYRFYEPGSAAAERVPPESRVILPSREVAEVWQQEQ